jgi:general secretion pathway protein A
MYLNFYNMNRAPFNITPDPAMLYLSPSHKEALAAVIYGVNTRKGFIVISGEVGLGKTTIIRSFLDRSDRKAVRAIYVFNPVMSFVKLLKTVLQGLGCPHDSEDDVCQLVDRLHLLLIDEYREGRNVVLIIDEAQNMPMSTLENLRMLSNLETSTDKLIQIVFCGQPEFERKLDSYALRQLKQRVAIKVKIQPLSLLESLEYINHRLEISLQKNDQVFTSGALEKIIRESSGIPRVINILCDNCLITSYGHGQKMVNAKVAREIIAEQGGKKPGMSLQAALVCVLVCVLLAAGMYILSGYYFQPGS